MPNAMTLKVIPIHYNLWWNKGRWCSAARVRGVVPWVRFKFWRL